MKSLLLSKFSWAHGWLFGLGHVVVMNYVCVYMFSGVYVCMYLQLDGKVSEYQRSLQELRTRKARCDDEVNRKSKDKGRLEEASRHADSIMRQITDKVCE